MFGTLLKEITSWPVKNTEVASTGYGDLLTENLHPVEGSLLDFSALRSTAVPAGSRGRIVINSTDPTKLAEEYFAGNEIRLSVATWAPDRTQSPLPTTKEQITNGVDSLARCGFNAIRIHGIEYWIMSDTYGELEFSDELLDLFDWFLAECKRLGLYWIINPRQPELYQAGPMRFTMPAAAKNYKQRIFTQQDARDNWRAGFDRLYNRVNPYTGLNILKDPALFLVECFNECGAAFVAAKAWPSVWTTRDAPQGTGALTWREWLNDPSMEHGYNSGTEAGRLAQINTSWGTGYLSISAIPEPSGTELPDLTMVGTQRTIDVILYLMYLDDELGHFFAGEMEHFECPALYCALIAFPNAQFIDRAAGDSANQVCNLHNYPFLAQVPAPGANLGSGVENLPIWSYESWMYTAGIFTSNKPSYIGEYGWPYWGQYRNQYPMLAAFAALQGAPAVSLFYQGDFFSDTYDADAKSRIKAMYPLAGHSDPVVRFSEVVNFFLHNAKDVTESSVTKTLIINRQYYGIPPSTRVPGRVTRALFNLFLPTMLYGALCKTRLNWTSDTTDNSLAATEGFKSWATICSEALAGTGFSGPAIAAGNEAYVSSQANFGTITAVAISSVVGSVTASGTQPVLTLSGSNTLVDGDQIAILSLTGTGGTWPGTDNRGTRATIKQTGVANRVQITSGLTLTGTSGFTAGTWSEFANEMESGTGELFVSRRRKFVAVDSAKAKFIAAGVGATLPTISDIFDLTVPELGALFIRSMDGAPVASSKRLLLAACGNPRNTGDTFSSNNTVMDTVGGYPIQIQDGTYSFSLPAGKISDWKLYRLGFDGQREQQDFLSGNAATNRINVSLRPGNTNPTVFWELIRQS